MPKQLNMISEHINNFKIGKNGFPTNEIERYVKLNHKGKPMYNKNGNPMYNGNIFFNKEGKPFYKNSPNQILVPPELYVKYQGNIQNKITPDQFIKHEMSKYTKQNNSQNSNKIRTNSKTGFKYLKQGEKRIKVNSSGQPEKYANGRNVILGEQGYPINNEGKFLRYDVKTGDLVKNSSGNPYVYIPDLGGFKVHSSEKKFINPPSLPPAELRNTAKSFSYAKGPGQALEPARLGQKSESPPGGFKVHKTPPESLLKFTNNPAGNNESNNSHLFKTGKHKESDFFNLLSRLSLPGKKKNK